MHTHHEPSHPSPMQRDFVNAEFLHKGAVRPLAYGSVIGTATAHALQTEALGTCLGAKSALLAGLGTGGTTAILFAVVAIGEKLRNSGVSHEHTKSDPLAFEHEKPLTPMASLRDMEPVAARQRLH